PPAASAPGWWRRASPPRARRRRAAKAPTACSAQQAMRASAGFRQWWSRTSIDPLLRCRARRRERIVVEDRRQPLLGFGDAPALAPRIVLDLVPLDLAAPEIVAVGVAEIEPAHRGARPHREALGEPDADAALPVKKVEQRGLLAVVGLRRIARRRAYA